MSRELMSATWQCGPGPCRPGGSAECGHVSFETDGLGTSAWGTQSSSARQRLTGRTYHVQERVPHRLALREAARPVVTRAASLLGDEYVLWVEQVAYLRRLDGVDDPARAAAQVARCGRGSSSGVSAT
jgi:hypothetical protein